MSEAGVVDVRLTYHIAGYGMHIHINGWRECRERRPEMEAPNSDCILLGKVGPE